MKPPCIVVVQYVLPAIRFLVAKELVEKHGLKRLMVAKKMGITPAAVTQYLKEVRGERAVKIVESSDEAIKVVSKIAEGLAKDDVSAYDVMADVCRACRIMMSDDLLCEMHREMLPALKESGIRECRCPILPSS